MTTPGVRKASMTWCPDCTMDGRIGPSIDIGGAADFLGGTETPEGREFLARQAAGCFCCYGYPDDPGPAPAYWWLTWQGVWLGLCARCCIRWRHFAATDTSEWSQRGQVAPLRITSLRPALDAA